MTEKVIVITGASSHLGNAVLSYLRDETNAKIVAIVSPRSNTFGASGSDDRTQYVCVDLTKPLPPEVKNKIHSAHFIFHFAWLRGKDIKTVHQLNKAMIQSLMGSMADPSRFYFISSVAASPHTLSVYGQAKYQAMKLVQEGGGVSLVCGLVVDQVPKGPYKMLTSCVRKLPFSVRFKGEGPQVYPVRLRDVALAVHKICESGLPAGIYRLYPRGISLNDFLEMIEKQYSRTGRLAIMLDTRLILSITAFLKRIHLAPAGLSEKVLTFLYKEPDYLNAHWEIPNLSYQGVPESGLPSASVVPAAER